MFEGENPQTIDRAFIHCFRHDYRCPCDCAWFNFVPGNSHAEVTFHVRALLIDIRQLRNHRLTHSAPDAALALVHNIQASRRSGHVGVLILFDVQGFFDNINIPQMLL